MSEATRIPELFGSLVFNERTMEQYVPQSAMDVWRGCLKSGQPLPLSAANEIADAMVQVKYSTATFFMQEKVAALS